MAQLVIEGLEVEVTIRSNYAGAAFGDFARAKSGRMRSDIMGHHRTLRFSTIELSTADALALRTLLQSPGPLRCWGDFVGVAADFHCFGFSSQPLTADWHVVDFDLHETNSLASSPLLFSFDGDAPGNDYFHDRTGAAYYIDADGSLASAAEDEPRFAYPLVNGERVRALLLERGSSNLIPSVDIATWSAGGGGTPVVDTGEADPFGGTDAFRVEDDSAAQVSRVDSATFQFGSSGGKNASVFIKEGDTPGATVIKLRDQTASADLFNFMVSGWTDGVPTLSWSVGTQWALVEWPDGWWEIHPRSGTVTSGNSYRWEVAPAGYTAANTGDLRIFWPQQHPSDYSTFVIDGGGSTNQDTFYKPFTHAPQAMTAYGKIIPNGSIRQSNSEGRILHIGDSGSTSPRFDVSFATTSGEIIVGHITPAGTETRTLATGASWHSVIEYLATLFSDGSVQLSLSIDGGAVLTSTRSDPNPLGSAWGGDRCYLGYYNGARGLMYHLSHKIVAGAYTDMDEARAFAAARLHPRVA